MYKGVVSSKISMEVSMVSTIGTTRASSCANSGTGRIRKSISNSLEEKRVGQDLSILKFRKIKRSLKAPD